MPRVRLASVAALTLLAAAASAAPEPRAHVDYLLQCQGCHRADGSGAPGSVPSFVDSVGRFLTVSGGREYLIRVPGAAQSPLSDAALAAVLNWIIRAYGPASVAADFEPFSAEEVTRHRRPPLVEVDEIRAELLGRLPLSP